MKVLDQYKNPDSGMIDNSKGAIMKIVSIVFSILCLIPVNTRANDLYNSLVESIDQANSQAHITLRDGVYITRSGDSKMIWDLTGGNRATVVFRFANRTLQHGSISFFNPLKIEIRAASGLCSTFTVKKLSFDVGGALDPDGSDFRLTPTAPGACNYSKNALLLEQHLAIENDSGRFFHGRVFSSSGSFRKCKNTKCDELVNGQPVTKVVFFSKDLADGALDAIAVSLRPNATLRLPNSGGWIQVGDGAQAKVSQLSYDLISESGSGYIKEMGVNVRSGSISTGDNVINLEKGSRLLFSSIDVENSPGVTSIRNGDISGALGSQSVILLSSSNHKNSSVIFDKGEVSLKHIVMTFANGGSSFKAQYAQMKGEARDANLFFSERNNLSFVNVSFQVDLKCVSPGDDCYAIEWHSGGQVKALGTISPFEANVRNGSWELDAVNSLRIIGGAIHAPILSLDTSSAFFPISGKFDKFSLHVDSQDMKLGPGVTVALASVQLESDQLTLSPDESYPHGAMKIIGSIKSATFGNVDAVGVSDASMSLRLNRKPADTVRVEDGTISARAEVKTSMGDRGAASVTLTNVKAYGNDVNASLSIELSSLRTTVTVPPQSKSDTGGGDLLKVETNVNIYEVPIGISLAQPILLNSKLQVVNGTTTVAPMREVPLALDMFVPAQELVYAKVNVKPAGGFSSNFCNPKVHLNGGTYRINGKVDFGVDTGKVNLVVKNLILEGDISMRAEDRNCKYVAGAVCGTIGALAGGPGGAIAGAYLCGANVQQAEEKASEKINEAVHQAITSYQYTLGQ